MTRISIWLLKSDVIRHLGKRISDPASLQHDRKGVVINNLKGGIQMEHDFQVYAISGRYTSIDLLSEFILYSILS
jgi:hypothetical protein